MGRKRRGLEGCQARGGKWKVRKGDEEGDKRLVEGEKWMWEKDEERLEGRVRGTGKETGMGWG